MAVSNLALFTRPNGVGGDNGGHISGERGGGEMSAYSVVACVPCLFVAWRVRDVMWLEKEKEKEENKDTNYCKLTKPNQTNNISIAHHHIHKYVFFFFLTRICGLLVLAWGGIHRHNRYVGLSYYCAASAYAVQVQVQCPHLWSNFPERIDLSLTVVEKTRT